MQKQIGVVELARQHPGFNPDLQQWLRFVSSNGHIIQTTPSNLGISTALGGIAEKQQRDVYENGTHFDVYEDTDLENSAYRSEENNPSTPSVSAFSTGAHPLARPNDSEVRSGTETHSDAQRGWVVRAPRVEKAVTTLLLTLCRMPTDLELARELHLSNSSYQDMLGYLRGLDMVGIYGQDQVQRTETQVMPWPRNSHEEAGFQCVLHGMQELLKGAIGDVADPERLALSFDYSDGMGFRDIWVDLELAAPTSADDPTSAHLRLCAQLFDAQRDRDFGGPWQRQRAQGADRQIPDVVLHGTQKGWLPTLQIWERLAERAVWSRTFRRWYSFDGTETLSQFRSKDEYSLKIES